MTPWEILGQLMATVLRFFPRVWWCPAYISGVLFVRGKNVRSFGPGRVVWFPLWTSMLTCATTRQVMDIDPQTVTTKDGKSAVVAGVCSYKIDDHVKYLVDNYEAEHSLDEAVAACLRGVVIGKTWQEIQENNRNTTDHALTREAALLLKEFGVTVERVRLTSLAQAKVINLVGGNLGVIPDEED